MHKKYLLTILCLLLYSSCCLAKNKHKSAIKLYGANFFYPGVENNYQIKQTIRETPKYVAAMWAQLGTSYERKVNRKWGISVGYHKWNTTKFFNGGGDGLFDMLFSRDLGKLGLWSRINLQFYDLSALYTPLTHKNHKVTVGLGVSFQKGYSTYIDSVSVIYGSFVHEQLFGHSEYKEYWGVVPSISYDYFFLHKWASAGIDIRERRYFNYDYTQVEFGIHLGVHF